MGKRITMVYTRKGESRHRNTALVLISVVFLLGGILGYIAQDKVLASTYVHLFLNKVGEKTIHPAFGQEIWNIFRWPGALLILRAFSLGGILIPIVVFLRGFLLSFGISAFATESLRTAVLLFGPTCVLTLPVLFILSTEILLRRIGEQRELKPAVVLACLLALCLCVVIDLAVVPLLLV